MSTPIVTSLMNDATRAFLALLPLVFLLAACGDDAAGGDEDVAADATDTATGGDADADDAADDADDGNDATDGGAETGDADDVADSDADDAPDADVTDATDTETSDTPDAPDADAVVPDADAEADADVPPDADVADGSGDTGADTTPDGDVGAPCETTSAGPEAFELGTGLDAFVPLEDGDEVLMTEGIQGGFHIWGGLRGTGFDPADAEASFTVENAAGETVGALVWIGDYECDESADAWATYGLTVFLDFEVWPPDVDGERWTMCVNATMTDGTTFEDCKDVVVRCCDWLFGPPDE